MVTKTTKWPQRRNLVALIILLLILALFFLVFYKAWDRVAMVTAENATPDLNKEWELTLNVLLQLIFITSLGVAATPYVNFKLKEREDRRTEATNNREKARERRTTRVAALQKFRNDLVETSHSINKLRRTLRASSFPTPDGRDYYCEREVFERLMDQMEDMQLQIASLKDGVEAHQDLFGVGAEKCKLHAFLGTVDSYLRELLRGYENRYADRRELKATDLIQLGPALTAFIHSLPAPIHRKDEPVEKGFFHPIHEARKLVVRLIERNVPAEPETENRDKNTYH
jgi:hypothetical protein